MSLQWSIDDPRIMARKGLAVLLIFLLVSPQAARAADPDPTQIATSAIEFGGSLGKLLWVTHQDLAKPTVADAERYTRLASRIKEQIDFGRASSSLIKSNFKVVSAGLAYVAAGDPEPLSKVATGIAAWGAKKAGDALGQRFVDEAQARALEILSQGLKESGLSQADLKKMSPEELGAKVSDLRVGGQKLGDALKDDQQSLDMLRAHAIDIATDLGVQGLVLSKTNEIDIDKMKKELAATRKNLEDFQAEVGERLTKIEAKTTALQSSVEAANQKLSELNKMVQGNSRQIQTLAQISFSGWTTSQKLQAVQTGLFPDLTPDQQKKLVESLEADQAREKAIADVQKTARDLGNLAAIAANLGLPKDLVTGLQGAQTVATSVAQFASGDNLGGISTVTSLAGLGASDAGAARHAALMKYLEQQFGVVNQKLDKIIVYK